MGVSWPAQPAPRRTGLGSTFLTGQMGTEKGRESGGGPLSSQLLLPSSSKAPRIDPNVLGICSTAWGPKTWCLSLPSTIRWEPRFIRTLSGTHCQPGREELLLPRIIGWICSWPGLISPLGKGPGLIHLWFPPTRYLANCR